MNIINKKMSVERCTFRRIMIVINKSASSMLTTLGDIDVRLSTSTAVPIGILTELDRVNRLALC